MCPRCQSLDWEAVELSGRGTVHSFIEPVHPPLPMFEPGYLVALIDLEEGIRMLSNLVGIAAEEAEVGMAVGVCFAATADEKQVPQFRPLGAADG